MASDLWESELLRARQWLAAGRKDAHQEQQQIFERVKSHIQFRDHQRSLQSATTASEDEGDDLALDFLGDVDASDMNALLQAEAAKASVAPPPVEMATPSLMPSASDLLKPLEMPANLVSPKLKPTGKATVPMSQLKPKNIATGRDVGASATLGNDADVQKLMSDLQLDVTQLQQSDNEREEGKTEESTPPHLLKTYGAITKGTSNGSAQDKLRRLASHGIGSGRAAPSSYMHQATSKSPTEPHRKLAAASATSKSDDVAAEMLSWVSGYRDPAVIRRKEEMARRKRKTTRRYGVNSEEERRQALRELKQVTHRSSSSGSDSDSDGDFSSDYSPAEDVPEQEEPEEVDLLSDDYLNSDEDKQPKRRKRLRQTHVKQKKKKTRSRKPTITRKLSQPDASSMNQTEHEQGRETQSAQERQHVRKPVAIAGSSSQKSVDMSSKVTETIDLLSSGDDEADDAKDAGSSRIVEPFQKKNTESGSIDSTRLAHSKVTKMKKLSAFPPSAPTSAPTQIADNKGNDDKVTGDSTPLVATGKSVGDEQSLQGGGDDDFSDTGTVDLEGEELSLESDEKNREEKSDVTEVITGNSTNEEQVDEISNANSEPTNNGAHTEDQFADRNTGRSEESDSSIHATEVIKMSSAGKTSSDRGTDVLESSKMPSAGIKRSEPTNLGSNPDAPPHSREENNYDVSEAETEILDDDDVASDDLGLDYSDDSDPEKRAATDENTTDQKAAHKQQGNDELKQKDEGGMDVTKAGVQQFFEYGPLTLKPKAKTTTRKKIPIHNYAETHLSKSDSSAGKTTEEPKKTPVQATQPSIGSNGLRPSKKTIATTTSMKGKYAVTRRSTKLLSPDETPGGNRQRKSQYTMVLTRTRAETQDGEMSLLAKELSKESGRTSDARYLSYDGAKKTEDAPRYPAEAPRIVPKSRYGGGSQSTTPTAVQNSSVVSNGEHMQNGIIGPRSGYKLQPQISIYDALGIDGKENASDVRDGSSYKRPSRFKKMQAEAAEKGVPMVRSRLQDTDWDKVPIPKKKKQPPLAPETTSHTPKTSDASAKKKNIRRKTNSGPSKSTGPSYYGPSASQTVAKEKFDSPSYNRRGGSNSRRDDDRRMKRSPSPRARDRHRDKRGGRERDDRRRRRSRSYSRSRSRSPRGRDSGSNHYRRRSRSRSWSIERSRGRSRERSSERDRRHTDRSPSSSNNRTSPNLGETRRHADVLRDQATVPTWSAKKQKITHDTEETPTPGALAAFDDNDVDVFISDSDDDGGMANKEAEDIRFNLDRVPVDEVLMSKQVYVTGVNPTVCSEQLEEDFARFGVAVDRDVGFPAIDIFPCQRNHLGRGDACITFDTEDGAQAAVEELNSKNIKNSMIRVRRMDAHTQRILTLQFKTVRDTWKCTGTQCRADVSIWNAKCDKCGRKRVYGPSNIKIGAESWLCSLCYTANDSFATSCHGCMEALPEVDRSSFYTS